MLGVRMPRRTTISLIKCNVGSLADHHVVPKPLFNIAEKNLGHAEEEGLINSHCVFNAGDDLQLVMLMIGAGQTMTSTSPPSNFKEAEGLQMHSV